MSVKLSPRLSTAVPYVRPGHLVADIGTDHAYLPIYLCESGILTPARAGDICALAADINRGPVERAALHIAAAGLSDRIATVQTDGLTGLELYDPADIMIFGMGGELIAAILAAAPWVRAAGKRLILQPMTHADRLRAYLCEAGFSIVGETLSREGERIYQTLCAEWESAPAPALSPAELCVGQRRHRGEDADQLALFEALLDKTVRTETAARDARRGAGQDTTEGDALIASLSALRTSIARSEETT